MTTKKDKKIERDLRWIMDRCREIANTPGKFPNSCPVFFPAEGDEYLFEELVKRRQLRREPLEGGYMFPGEHAALYLVRKDENDIEEITEENIVAPKVEEPEGGE